MLLSIFWWQQQRKKEPVSFWYHYRCYVLLPRTLLEVIQIRNHCYGKESNVQKYYCDNDFAKTNCITLIPTILDQINRHL